MATMIRKNGMRFITSSRLLVGGVRWNSDRCRSDNKSLTLHSSCPGELSKPSEKEMACSRDVYPVEPGRLSSDCRQPSVVIIGAGMAGLSTAHRLIQSGLKNVTILEGTDRPGGRIWTGWIGDTVVELGAGWIGEGISDSVHNLACVEGLFKSSTSRNTKKNKIYLARGGRPFTMKEADFMVHDIMRGLQNAPESSDLFQYLLIRIQQALVQFPRNLARNAELVLAALFNKLRSRWGTSVSQMSLVELRRLRKLCPRNRQVPVGCVATLAPLLRGLPTDCIRYKKTVCKINWAQNPILIQMENGETMEADHVVVTLPLGVLKESMDTMFNPPLPNAKRDAINAIGVGNITKVFLEYEKSWWGVEEPPMVLTLPIACLKENDWTTGVGQVQTVPGSNHLVSFTVGGSHAVAVEETCDEHIAWSVTSILRDYLGNPTISTPKNVVKSHWGTSPFFLGGTSFCSAGPEERCHVAEPLYCGRFLKLLFAGEATSVDNYSSLHGARVTGLHAASEIVDNVIASSQY